MTDEADNKDEWLDYRDAAKLMHRPAAYLRERNADGVSYRYFPEIERWQPGGRRTKLFVRREHVERWIESTRTPVEVKTAFSGVGYQSIVPELRQLGAPAALYRALGLERHIQVKSKPTARRKAKKGSAK